MVSRPPSSRPGELPLSPAVVLDTNVVLDWLLFAEPAVADLAAAIAGRRVEWLATAGMRDELAAVLGGGLAAARQADPAAILTTWDTHAVLRAATVPHHLLRCSDPDDQKFIDLAVGSGARWLISRDRAVLRLARRAARQGLAITAPRAWCLDAPTATPA
jgi:predicted nucleic acid-binding protein